MLMVLRQPKERDKVHVKLELFPFLTQRMFLGPYISRKANVVFSEVRGCLARIYHLPLPD